MFATTGLCCVSVAHFAERRRALLTQPAALATAMGDGFLDDVGDSHKMDMANGPAAPPLLRASTSSKTPEEFREYYAATKLQARYRGRQGRQGTQTTLHAARKAAEQEHASALHALGQCYYSGVGTPVDMVAADACIKAAVRLSRLLV